MDFKDIWWSDMWNIFELSQIETPMAPSPAISLLSLTLALLVKLDKPRGSEYRYFGIGHCPLWAAPLGFVGTDLLLFCKAKQPLNMVESCNFERWSL